MCYEAVFSVAGPTVRNSLPEDLRDPVFQLTIQESLANAKVSARQQGRRV